MTLTILIGGHEVSDLTALAGQPLYLHLWPASTSQCRVQMGRLSASGAWAVACLQVTRTALQLLVFANSCV
jgi:hypothetical protein